MGKSFMQRWFASSPSRAPAPAAPTVGELAENGDAEAQFQLGLKYSTGDGVAQDQVQAAAWYRKAAEQNHALAQFKLGLGFADGLGVERDATQAAFWFRRAANLGVAGAQFNLARICQRASMDGAEADAAESRIESYMWYELAAAQHYKAAEGAYAQLTYKMTCQEVAEARRRVDKFAVRNGANGDCNGAVQESHSPALGAPLPRP